VEGWKYSISEKTESKATIEINECPYKAIMDRNPERTEKIPLICKDMCIPFYKEVVDDFNSQIKIERKEYMGLGDRICDFHFEQNE
jgi:hypothetical protein